MKILHVDDEEEFRDLVSFFLKRQGDFEVEPAESAEAALELMKTRQYDALVVDYSLPGMDGIELLKIVRAQGNKVPVVLFTGRGREDTAAQALNNGADFYLEKGTNLQAHFVELANMLSQTVRARRMDEDIAANERFLSDVFSSIQDGVSILDRNLDILRVNGAMERWYAHNMPLVGKKCYDAYHGRDRHCEVCPSLRTIESGKSSMEVVPKIGPEKALVGWLEVYSFPMMNSRTGELTGVIEYVRDITDRRKAELELNETLDRYRALQAVMDKSPAVLFIWAPAPGAPISYVSDGIARFGYSRQDFVTTYVYDDIIHKDDLERNRREFRDAVESGADHFAQEYRIVTKSGETRWVEDHTYVQRDPSGKPSKFEGVVIDITDRKLGQQKSEELTTRMQAIIEAFPDLYFHVASDGTILDFNATRLADLYVPPQTFLGKRMQDVMPPDVGKQLVDGMSDVQKTGKIASVEYSLELHGERRAFEARLVPIAKGDTLVVVRDMTGRKRAQEALRESESRYRQLVTLAQEGIIMTDKDSNITFANARMAQMLGYSEEEILGRPVFQYLDESSTQLARNKLNGRRKSIDDRYEMTFVKKDGGTLRASLGVTSVTDKSGQYAGALAVIADTTDRVRYEEALEAANKKLSLLGHVTRHDVLNQIAVLVGWIQIAEQTATEKAVKGYLKNMKIAAETIQRQLNFAGDYQRMGITEPTWINLQEAFSDGIVGLFTEGISISVNLKGVQVYADPMFERIFHNLVDDSIRHGERVSKISVHCEQGDDELRVVYEDDGVGIPAKEKAKLFERGHGRHTGFGLFMVREILAITGITIEETGTPGKGVRFVMHVPVRNYRAEDQ